MTLHVASLFSGIGLIDLGFHRAAIPTRLLCEADPAARSVLARRFSGTPIHDDVRELTADDLRAACDADPSTAPGSYCASLACRCGHPACPAAASWVPREGQARVIHLPTPRTT